MSKRVLRCLTALAILAVVSSGCAKRSETPLSSTLTEDDDTYCRARGAAVGSSEYVACRKDRDAQRSNAVARADKTQRNLGELMINTPPR